MRKNEKGSSLIFALAVISIITMVIAACMAISYSYYNRSIVANSERQAYLTAKSVLTNIVDNITAKDIDYLSLIPEQGKGEVSYNVDDRFPSSEMGTVDSITMIRNLDEKDKNDKFLEKLTVSVIVTYGKSNKQINADLKQYDGDNDNWQLSKYYESEVDNRINNNITKAENLKDAITPLFTYVNNIFNETDKNKQSSLKNNLNNWIIEQSGNKFNYDKGSSNVMNNTSCLRPFVYHVLQNSEPEVLDINEFNLPKDLKDVYKDTPLYLHVMFGTSGSQSRYFIYATTKKNGVEPDWKANFIYLPENGHWYYKEKYNYNNTKIVGSEFDDMGSLNQENADQTYKKIIDSCTETRIAQ